MKWYEILSICVVALVLMSNGAQQRKDINALENAVFVEAPAPPAVEPPPPNSGMVIWDREHKEFLTWNGYEWESVLRVDMEGK